MDASREDLCLLAVLWIRFLPQNLIVFKYQLFKTWTFRQIGRCLLFIYAVDDFVTCTVSNYGLRTAWLRCVLMRVETPFFVNGSLIGPITITHELCLCGRVKENPKGWTRSLAPFKFNNKVTYWVLSRRLIEYLDGDGVFLFLTCFSSLFGCLILLTFGWLVSRECLSYTSHQSCQVCLYVLRFEWHEDT